MENHLPLVKLVIVITSEQGHLDSSREEVGAGPMLWNSRLGTIPAWFCK